MKRWPWLVLVLVSLVLVIRWPRKEATKEQREEQRLENRAKAWKEDSKACNTFASRRDDARTLLAYDPEADSKKTPEQKYAEAIRAIENLAKNPEDSVRLLEADRRSCLRGEGWKDEWIDELEAKDREKASSKATGRTKGLSR